MRVGAVLLATCSPHERSDMREYYTWMSFRSSGLLNGAIMAVTIAIALITASCLHVASPPQSHEAMPKLAQYCLPDQHDADRVFCGL